MRETITVLVPDDEGVELLAGVDGLRPVRYSPDEPLPSDVRAATVLVAPFLGRSQPELVEQLPALELVQLLTAGYEAWQDAIPDGVVLSSGRGAHGGSTGEWVLAGLLALHRDLPAFVRAQDRGEWDFHPTGTLQDSTALIIGAGDVASQIRRRLEPFDVTVTQASRTPRDGVHGMDEVAGLLGEQDAVIVAIPLADDTRQLVDAEFLARMRDGSVLVNAARGPVVDTDALVAELTSRRLRAVLDVTDPEPLPTGHPLWSAPGLVLTPHIGGSVDGRFRRAYTVAAQQIQAFAEGRDPDNRVRLPRP